MNRQKSKILIVDDERRNIDILGNILRDDYEILATRNGEQTLKLLQSGHYPDLILLDIMMPDLDGYEVCKRLKADEKTENIPVVFVTAMNAAEDETKGLELGAVDYIAKPVCPSIVRARVKTHLNLKLAYTELAQKNQKLEEAALLRENVERISRHDLKSPLSGIINIPEILIMDPDLSEDQKNLLKTIKRCGYRMLNMINHSLDLYKMEMKTYQYNPGIVELVSLLHEAVMEIHSIATAKKLCVEILLHGKPVGKDDLFAIAGERLLCYSLFANLLKNALEASPEEKRVTISLEEKERMCFITIHNAGTVPEEIRQRFFDKYVTAGKFGGTGLGTYSAKLMAETQGGGVYLQTSEETGTAVSVRLPKAAVDGSEEKKLTACDALNAKSRELPLVVPPQSILQQLYEFARCGDIRGIETGLNEIEYLDKRYRGFLTKLRALTDELQMRKLRNFIKQHLENRCIQ
ncbi:MAG: response regulator [Gammaproteobacteria bacterium]|nr:response regulator [Gammaproteobacteria bacterium]